MMGSIKLGAPMHGWVSTLDSVPDPVFSGRLLGDGLAIDPVTGELLAPCDGNIQTVHTAGHAVTMTGDGGIELLMHIGVDTVELDGKGFAPLVAPGDRVVRGQPLVRFDLDAVACAARSLATPMIVTNGEAFTITRRVQSRVVAPEVDVLWLEPVALAEAPSPQPWSATHASQPVVVMLAHGIHARPAARIGATAKQFQAQCRIVKGDKVAAALSPIGLLGLSITCGETIAVEAQGDDAEAAVAAIVELIASGMGETAEQAEHSAQAAAPMPTSAPAAMLDDGTWIGTTAAPGIAVGQVRQLRHVEPEVEREAMGQEAERARLEQAMAALCARLGSDGKDEHEAAIRKAHKALLDDPALAEAALGLIAEGASAPFAWRTACAEQAAMLRGLGDARLAERADDLLDIGRQVVAILLGTSEALPSFPAETILIAREMLPSQIMQLDENVIGIALEQGGPTSHVAILAASIGIPMLVALGDRLATIDEGQTIVLDADHQALNPQPMPDQLVQAREQMRAQAAQRAASLAAAHRDCVSADGTRIEIFANLGSLEDAHAAMQAGAEGCGLLRTEFLFLERAEAPTEKEQAGLYGAIAKTLDGRPLIIRLMDIGGDKPAPYLPIGPEVNPALGLRGIRVSLAHPDMLDAQLRAALSVQPVGQCRIMVPMVASVAELLTVRDRVEALRRELAITAPVEVGIMVETPAAAVTTATLARHADFFSIGTNDLTQYALAMDRDNPAVASGLDGLHPAVLALIAHAARGAQSGGRWIGVCGGLAADRLAVPLLLGLGITELSMPVRQIPEIKSLVRRLDISACRALAAAALDCESPQDVRALSRRFIEELTV